MKMVAKFVGLDVHKDTITMAVCDGGPIQEPMSLGRIPHEVPKLLKRLAKLGEPADVQIAYEAGPTGYGLFRALREKGYTCIVIAPSRMLRSPGDIVKTDERDAKELARQLRAGLLVPISIPDVANEALRDMTRYRGDVREHLHEERQRLNMFLLRHSRHFPGKSHWTKAHWEWIRSQRFEQEPQRQVLEESLQEVTRLEQKLERLDKLIEAACSASDQFKPLFKALQGFRGMSMLTAATIVAEVGDLRRFKSAPEFMCWVGLTPREYSSGPKVTRGSITKNGNGHVRRMLVESGWHCRHRPTISVALKKRSACLPEEVTQIAWKAQHRLYKRYWGMVKRSKPTNVAVIAMARELAGFVWAVGQIALPQSA